MSEEELAEPIARHRSRGALVDSNLLLLFLVGLSDVEMIPKFKRTHAYRVRDFELLHNLIRQFERVITSPNIATEVNGLANQLRDDWRERFTAVLRERVALMEEQYVASAEASIDEQFADFGLTDVAILTAARNDHLVLTDDAPLYHLLSGDGLPCINFNHLRGLTP